MDFYLEILKFLKISSQQVCINLYIISDISYVFLFMYVSMNCGL